MKWHFTIMKQILSGIIFLLLPVTIMIIIFGKAISIVRMLILPIKKILPVERVFGIGLITIISILLILFACFLAGAMVENKMVRAAIKKLEDHFLVFIPGYS